MVAPSSALETSAPELTPTVEETSEQVMGYTEAPGQTAPTPMEKVIDYCGDPSIHETGTTFFTDGTSGWTQQCADEMAPAVAQQFVAPPANDTPAYTGGGSGRTCAEIGHKVYPGDPDYSLERDKNGDGVGCESYPG